MTDSTARDTAQTAAAFLELDQRARAAGQAMAQALSAAQSEGRRLDDVLQGLRERLSALALQSAGRSLSGLFSSAIGSLTSAGGAALTEAGGETGSTAGSAGTRNVQVLMNVTTPDADSFRRSDTLIGANLARAVERGQRIL